MSKYYSGQEEWKKRSRDAARSRRGQQNDEYSELAHQLPLSTKDAMQLDRLSVMRLTNSFIKVKHFVKDIVDKDPLRLRIKQEIGVSNEIEEQLLTALDGFVFVIGPGGHCLYISDNVTTYLGLMPVEVTGNSFYKFIHPCDHEEVAKELGGKIPLEDMEIFDGLFCSDSVFLMSNNLKGGSSKKREDDKQPYRSFFVRMKSTLTSRGKSVNLKASTYRVVHCMGCMKQIDKSEKCKKFSFVGIGVPLMFTPTFEVPLDRCTFTSHHTLDLKFIYCEEWIETILGIPVEKVLGRSLYDIHHGSDSEVLTNCHKTLLTKGQSVSGYYRLLASCGGWVWVQTKASIVYASKSCQPQFVLCVHYAISGVQEEDCVVSLDQLRVLGERQRSPSNSPAADKYRSNHRKRFATTRVISETLVRNLDTATQTTTGAGNNNSNNTNNSNNANNSNTTAAMAVEYPQLSMELSVEDDKLSANSDEGSLSLSASPCFTPGTASTPNQDTSFYGTTFERSAEHCAPFVPPPVVDSPILMSWDDMFPMVDQNETMLWTTDQWEIYDTERSTGPTTVKTVGYDQRILQRNLSTPKFYPESGGELPVLKREEIEMSTPVLNLPLLQGNEIWFALDQSKEP